MPKEHAHLVDLKGRTVILTGGAGLIGNAFSKAIALCGANLIIADIDEKKANLLADKLRKETGNNNIIAKKCNITNEKSIKKIVAHAVKNYGSIDVLINNAYPKNKNYGNKFEDVTYKDFCENLGMHLGGYFLMSKEVSNIMVKQRRGSIINIASIYGISAPDFRIYQGTKMTNPPEYAAIKGGLIMLSKYMATYFADHNVRVNCISPGGMFDNQPDQFVKNYVSRTPLQRMAKPEDLIGALLYLASDASSYVTGQNIVVDGGWTVW